MTRLSVIVPVLNEERTLREIVESLYGTPIPDCEFEVIVVDDGSEDRTPAIIRELQGAHPGLQALRHPRRRGKGAGVRTGIAASTGDIVLIQDADLEYRPADIPRLIRPITDGHADVVYGSRFTSPERRVNYFWTTKANQGVTFLTNLCYNANFSDVYTGYKAMRGALVRGLRLESASFTIEVELTAKLRRAGARFYEVPITYHARTYEEGKKIGVADAIRAVGAILYHRFSPLR
jgi:glycosyltransferase involved in cell wall biosynthesis